MAAIFWLSQQPSLPIPMKYPYQDKLFHGIAYFVLSLLLAHAVYPGSHKKRFALAFLIAALYGVSDEIHQAFVPGRDASGWDWLADAVGAWIGAFLYLRSKKSPGSGS
jgi:VanZ family protein